jgi:hypothetical protein
MCQSNPKTGQKGVWLQTFQQPLSRLDSWPPKNLPNKKTRETLLIPQTLQLRSHRSRQRRSALQHSAKAIVLGYRLPRCTILGGGLAMTEGEADEQ